MTMTMTLTPFLSINQGQGRRALEMMKMKKLKTLFFIKWKRRGKLQLLSSKITLTMKTMTNPLPWTCQKRGGSSHEISTMVLALLMYKYVYLH
jgi:hypothetical protein